MKPKVLIAGGTGHFGRLLAEDLRQFTDCELVIGNRTSANVFHPASIERALSDVSVAICRDGQWRNVRGWSARRDYEFPAPIGRRHGYLVDVPDHELFPALFGARTVEFRTSSELWFLNAALSSLALFVRPGLVRSWVP